MLDSTRLRNPQLFDKIVTPEEAAALITDGMNVGVSGFTPSGYPKKTTIALAKAIKEGNAAVSISGAALLLVRKLKRNWRPLAL